MAAERPGGEADRSDNRSSARWAAPASARAMALADGAMSARVSFVPVLIGAVWAWSAISGCARADAGSPASRTGVGGSDARADKVKPVASAPDDAAASRTALKWLSALRQRDRAGLVRQSGVPFVLRDASSTGNCSTLDINESSKLDSIGCLAKDDVLNEVLKANLEPDAGPLAQAPTELGPKVEDGRRARLESIGAPRVLGKEGQLRSRHSGGRRRRTRSLQTLRSRPKLSGWWWHGGRSGRAPAEPIRGLQFEPATTLLPCP